MQYPSSRMNSKFSVSSEAESLSLSRYNVTSDASSLQEYELDYRDYPPKIDLKKMFSSDGNNAAPASTGTASATTTGRNPFGPPVPPQELHKMFAHQEYQPRPMSAVFTIAGLAVGVAIGVLLSKLEASADIVSWVALPGKLYVDALICVVVPGVFCSVMIAVAEVVATATVRKIALFSALWFTVSALLASAVGTGFAAIFASSFTKHERVLPTEVLPQFAFKCASSNYLTMTENGTVLCGARNRTTASELFTVKATETVFKLNATAFETISVSGQIVAILSNMVPTNVLTGFVDGTYVSVVFTAFFFAIACIHGHDSRRGVPNYLILLVSQVGIVLRMVITVLLKFLPVAVISLVGGSIGMNNSSIDVLHDVVYLVIALVAASVVFVFILGGALYAATKRSVFTYLAHILPAQAFVLGCSSTMATLPMTIRCVDASGEVPPAVGRVVLPFGATCNLTGMSLYLPLAVVFLAQISGFGSELTATKYVLLWLLSAVASFGASTVENSEMVMVITVWRAILHRDPGDLFATLVVTDWLLQRLRTLVNVTTHAILARIITEHCRERDVYKQPNAFLVDSITTTPTSPRRTHF